MASIVDTEGEPLRRSMRAEPDVISPNVLEAEELVGHEFNDTEDHLIAVREMVALGAHEAIMTAPDGCYALMAPEEHSGPARLYRVRVGAGSIEPRATVGSGDAFLAGFVAARYGGAGTEECLVRGVACGAESTRHLGAGLIDPDRVERLCSDIEVERPELPAKGCRQRSARSRPGRDRPGPRSRSWRPVFAPLDLTDKELFSFQSRRRYAS